MCGRFTLRASAEVVAGEFLVILLEPLPPRYNIAPSQAIWVIWACPGEAKKPSASGPAQIAPPQSPSAGRPEGESPRFELSTAADQQGLVPKIFPPRQLVWMQWGLRWTGPTRRQTPSLLINLRTETALEKPRFRNLLQSRRCLILADGFYEWEKIGRGRWPYFIHRKDDRPFGMAGLWKPPASAEPALLPECVVLTTPANALLESIHPRMPALLLPEDYGLWLDPAEDRPEVLARLVRPYPSEHLEAYPVSERVNSPEWENPDCIQREDRPRQSMLFSFGEEGPPAAPPTV